MTQVTYEGPHFAVEITLEAGVVECDRGGSIDVPQKVADDLIAGGHWKLTKAAKSTSKKPAEGKES
jgi:hypothetical protein